MRLRSFTAPDMQSAMAQVRAALGEDAVILSATTDKTHGEVTITAAMEREDSPPPAGGRQGGGLSSAMRSKRTHPSPPPAAEGDWGDELAFLLRYHGVPEQLTGRLLYRARQMELSKLFALEKIAGGNSHEMIETQALTQLLAAVFRFRPLAPQAPGSRLMLIGPPGIGKTLTVARLATQLVMDKVPLTVITTDTKRAGGIEQLAAFTDILKLKLTVAKDARELGDAVAVAPPGMRLLIDTAGCNPYALEELQELKRLVEIGGFEPVLALPAGMDGMEAIDMARAFAFPELERLIVTRADTARRFGSALAAADARELAFAGIGDSASVIGTLKSLDAPGLARMLLSSHSKTP